MLSLNTLFCALLLTCSTLVVQSANPVYGVLYLILAFFNASALVLLCGHDYLAALFIVLYVGAMCTFFLFAIMILDIKVGASMEKRLKQMPVNLIIGGLFAFVTKSLVGDHYSPVAGYENAGPLTPDLLDNTSQIYSLGAVLYTTYAWHLIVAGTILLAAMLGSIVLTLNKSSHARKQVIYKQNLRDFRLTATKVR
jgi:NADH-quinone oxidoreductase subunit J